MKKVTNYHLKREYMYTDPPEQEKHILLQKYYKT